jgi:hypothetical protein
MDIPLPPSWVWIKDTIAHGWSCSEFLSFDMLTATYAIRKRISVNFETLQVGLSVYGIECPTQDVIPKSFTNIADLSNTITNFNERNICSGARLDHLAISDLKEVKNGICKHGTWRALR